MLALPIYLLWQIYYGITNFLEDWYIDGFRWWLGHLFGFLEALDKGFALKVTLRHFTEPLYGDRTIVGFFLGLIWRTLRIIIASVVYLLILSVAGLLFFLWVALPPLLLYKSILLWLPIQKL